MIIVGAGLSGLLAARRLWTHNPVIWEKQSELPNNHSALLRFRTNAVGEALGIPFKKVNVYKGIMDRSGAISNTPTVQDMNAYSIKATGMVMERSIINTEPSVRYIAPENLISQAARGLNILYNKPYDQASTDQTITISTIPMPELMKQLWYPKKPLFFARPIWTYNCYLTNVDVYQTIYLPYDTTMPYRISITGDLFTAEFSEEPKALEADFMYSMLDRILGYTIAYTDSVIKRQEYGKIIPIDDDIRQQFILWATDKFKIYSLGRFATWRQLLLDDVLKDIGVIDKFIRQRNDYGRTRHTVGE